ncbi:MAG: isoleucine--tRNA ligase [Cytophagales bacterium]|nr:isoleucine--tRNA ligase [Cytophagales bacterium]MDW8383934.1 isoleucine--tRNA ligase [Flammeovirgaceae bacterium]
MKYREYKGLDLPQIGNEIRKYWEENRIFEKSITSREGCPNFVFYEGPPSANGTPGIHHVMARTIKDIFCRYKTLKGYKVERKAGWDTHGLPVELQVEKELGISKEDIGKKISIAEYNQKCRETVFRYTEEWNELTRKMGYWVDLSNPYITYTNEYIESVWNLIKRLYEKGLLYKGYTIQPYSPAAGTGLSSHELNLPGCYKNVKDLSVIAQFKLIKNEKYKELGLPEAETVYMLAWTTTPWTLPSNAALAVGDEIEYVCVKTINQYSLQTIYVILAKDLVSKYFTEEPVEISKLKPGTKLPYKVIKEFLGKQLVGLRYEQLLPYVQPEGDAFRVISGDFVSTTDGTGIVHIAPTFGADDKRAAEAANIPAILVKDENGKLQPLVDKNGRFVKEVTDFAYMFVKNEYYPEGQAPEKSVDVLIAIKLKEEGKCFDSRKYEHSYPHCWRTDKPVLYYPLSSWFIRTTAMRERMVELNKTINWKPKSTGEGRFGNWLENLVDWNLSRSRYWGTPLPIWRTEDGTEEICIGSIDELEKEVQKAKHLQKRPFNRAELDLHRPYVDDIVLLSPSGKPMYREPDLIDVWFDSGAMPFAQWHYPFENQDKIQQRTAYPADFISEGVDQTRGWFFTLHAISVMLEDSVAFKNVVSTGLVLDKNGNKMSKRLGNVINPFEAIDQYGIDAVRWYMIENSSPWDNLKFNLDGVEEGKRKFFGTLYNTYAFFALYANLDNFDNSQPSIPLSERTELDRWILSRLHSLIKLCDDAYQDYEPTKVARALLEFVCEDLSNWYVRLSRKRFWVGHMNQDKLAAYQTLFECLITVAKILSPISPFYAERLFLDLNEVTKTENVESVHLSYFPVSNDSYINSSLEERMSLAQRICSIVHAIRKKEKIKVRQPLQKILIPDLDERVTQQIQAVEDIIKAEVNIKEIEFINDSSGILIKRIKPNFKALGAKGWGKMMKEIQNAIAQMQQEQIRQIEQTNAYKINVQGQEVLLTLEDVEIISEDIPGWSVGKDGHLTVALDIRITDTLRYEGIARELVNRIQNIRKDSGFDVQDKIRITLSDSQTLVNEAIQWHKHYICSETQALSLETKKELHNPIEIDLDDFTILAEVNRVQ